MLDGDLRACAEFEARSFSAVVRRQSAYGRLSSFSRANGTGAGTTYGYDRADRVKNPLKSNLFGRDGNRQSSTPVSNEARFVVWINFFPCSSALASSTVPCTDEDEFCGTFSSSKSSQLPNPIVLF